MSPLTSKIAERLRMLRARASLSQQQVADLCRCSASLVGAWERGQHEPDASQIVTLADRYGVSADYLLARSDYESGLAPDCWIVDLDVVENVPPNTDWCVKVPRRLRIVSYDEMRKLEAEIAQRHKQRRRGNRGDS